MKRAYLMEMTILKSYVRQLLGLGLFVCLCMCIGMENLVSAPGILTMMLFMMGSMSAAAYNEQIGWGIFRLTMPVSRCDVVFARYGVILTLGVTGALVGLVAVALLMSVGSTASLPGGLSGLFMFSPERVQATVFATMFGVAVGSTVAAVVTPIYFRLGQTKATQYIPMIVVLLFICPFVVLGGSGMLDVGAAQLGGVMRALADVLSFIETPAGVVAFAAVAALYALAVLGVSAAISLKLYEKREL